MATLRQAFDYYFESMSVAESTKKNKDTAKDKAESAGILDKPIEELTPAVMRKFLRGLSKFKPSYQISIVTQIQSVVNTFLTDHNQEKVSWDIFSNLSITEDEPGVFLTIDELHTLINKADDCTKKQKYAILMFCIGCLTGTSVVDLLKFGPANITKDNKWAIYHRTKTNAKCVIPVTPLLSSLMQKVPWPVRIKKRMFQTYCEGIISTLVGKQLSSHSMRKTAGAIFLEMGFSMESVALFLGHSNPQITAKIYAKVTTDKINAEMNKVNLI